MEGWSWPRIDPLKKGIGMDPLVDKLMLILFIRKYIFFFHNTLEIMIPSVLLCCPSGWLLDCRSGEFGVLVITG